MKVFTLYKAEKAEDLIKSLSIRRKVFVEEQQVDEALEMDGKEHISDNYLVCNSQQIAIGTCRCRRTEKGVKIERFAILPEFRKLGAGVFLINEILKLYESEDKIYLNAQEQVVNYYAQFNFFITSDVFYEAGIKHFEMEYKKRETV
jgi:predicted GNAT family N-acyltransferase